MRSSRRSFSARISSFSDSSSRFTSVSSRRSRRSSLRSSVHATLPPEMALRRTRSPGFGPDGYRREAMTGRPSASKMAARMEDSRKNSA